MKCSFHQISFHLSELIKLLASDFACIIRIEVLDGSFDD
jgi:hypothetical protein